MTLRSDLERALAIAMSHEYNLKNNKPADPAPELRGADVRTTGNGASGKGHANVICKFCKKPGHFLVNCPKVKAKKARGAWTDKAPKKE